MALDSRYRGAIQSIESGGDYRAVGPKNDKLGRALGAYQIMEANIGPWSKEILGREVSPAEFLAKPEIQDAIFDAKFGQYIDRFGEEGAAQAWFAGPGGVGKVSREDVLGTNVGQYGSRFMSALGGSADTTTQDTVVGQAGSDMLAANPYAAAVQEAQQPTPAEVYAATGALNPYKAAAEPLDIMQPRAYTPYEEEPKQKPFFDITAKTTQPSRELLSATGESIMGRGPSVAAQMLPEGIPEGLRETVGRALDIPLSALGTLGLGYEAGVGAVSDVAEALGVPRAEALARDLSAMPEAFAGTPGALMTPKAAARQAGMPTAAPKAAAQAVAQRIEPPISAPKSATTAAGYPKMARKELGDLIYKASRGNKEAMRKVAKLSDIDPEAAAAAKRLGIDVPADVLGQNVQIREIAGMLRTTKGSGMSKQWEDKIGEAATKAQELLRSRGQYEGIDAASDAVRRELTASIDTLRGQAGKLYDEAGKALPLKTAQLKPTNSINFLNEQLSLRSGAEALSGPARKLYNKVTSKNGLKYQDMRDLKTELGKAKFGQGAYKDADDWIVNSVYNAINDDLIAYANQYGSSEIAAKIQQANRLWAAASDLKDGLVSGFGKNADGSIASLMRNAMKGASQGDRRALTKAMRIVPEGMRKDIILSALDDAATVKTGTNTGSLSFQNFQKTWNGMSNQPGIMALVKKEIGPENFSALNDMGKVARKVQEALDQTQAAKRTGASLTAEVFTDGVLTRFMAGPVARTVTSMGAGVGGNIVGGPFAGAAAQAGVSSLKIGGKRAQAASNLFSSPAFQKMAMEAATTGDVTRTTANHLMRTNQYKTWAKANNITNPEVWLLGVIGSAKAQEAQK